MDKPIIGIVGDVKSDIVAYNTEAKYTFTYSENVDAVKKAGGCPILLPVTDDEDDIKKQVKICDGLLFPGGQDINPKFYGSEGKKKLAYTNEKVDRYQISIIKLALKEDMPMICICRGTQLLNCVCGGTLYQDLSERGEETLKHVQEAKRHETIHKIIIEKDSILYEDFGKEVWVNSFHHQAVKKLGDNLKVIARATDDIIEAVILENKKFVLGIQWHPEMMLSENNLMLPIFKRFILNCKNK